MSNGNGQRQEMVKPPESSQCVVLMANGMLYSFDESAEEVAQKVQNFLLMGERFLELHYDRRQFFLSRPAAEAIGHIQPIAKVAVSKSI